MDEYSSQLMAHKLFPRKVKFSSGNIETPELSCIPHDAHQNSETNCRFRLQLLSCVYNIMFPFSHYFTNSTQTYTLVEYVR